MKKWHDMKVRVKDTRLEGYLNGKLLLEYTLPEAVSGKVGLWSKTESFSYFDDFTVNAAQ
jgi:hypothetical protein